MIHLVRSPSDLRVISGSLCNLPLLACLTLLRQPLSVFQKGCPQRKGTSLFPTLKMDRTEVRKKLISTWILKYQCENKMSSEAQVFNRQSEEKSGKESKMVRTGRVW